MNKFFWLIILTCAFTRAQTATTAKLLEQTDFTMADGRMIASEVGCVIDNESTQFPISISIVCLQQAFNNMGVGKINDMILYADGMVRNSVKGAYTPSEFKMAYNPATRLWSLTNLFSVEESGVTKKSLMALNFDSAGNFLDIKRVF